MIELVRPHQSLSDRASEVFAVLSRMAASPVLVGGCALVAYGVPAPTLDIDFLVSCSFREFKRISKHLVAEGYRIDSLSKALLQQGAATELRFFIGGTQVDILRASTPRLKEVHACAHLLDWSGRSIFVAKISDVLIEKTRTGRTIDLAQFRNLIDEILRSNA
jgi:hypothetical protein